MFHAPTAMPANRKRTFSDARVLSWRTVFALFVFLVVFAVPTLVAKSSLYVVVVPVANMYSGPSDQKEVVSQAFYGSLIKLLVVSGEWSKIQTEDRFKGWTPSRYLRLVQTGTGYATSGKVVQVESLFANVYREPDVRQRKPLITIPFESRLEVISEGKGKDEGWLQVRLPDQRNAWLQAGDVVSDPKPLTISESVELAKRFLGLPYLWGGRSTFGYDCSGFTQMLLRSRGIRMPRNVGQQATWSGAIAVDRNDLRPGDLLFFGSSAKQITHTGVYIGDGQFIHDTSYGHPGVQISRLDDQPWTRLLVTCKRVK